MLHFLDVCMDLLLVSPKSHSSIFLSSFSMPMVNCALGFGCEQLWGCSLILSYGSRPVCQQLTQYLALKHKVYYLPLMSAHTHKYSRHAVFQVKVHSKALFTFHSTSVLLMDFSLGMLALKKQNYLWVRYH